MQQSGVRYTVGALTNLIRDSLETSFQGITVEGEVSGFRPASSGHWYFSLKDGDALIGAVMWRSAASRLGFRPEDGMKVEVFGSINVYPPRGTYQIVCSSIRRAGIGDILAALEERKRHYAALGYFDPGRKKPIPANPSRICVITSPTGAALQDILNVTKRRSNADIVVLPSAVQGEGADRTLASRIREANRRRMADVIIIGRGGGSIEDLLPFSSPLVIEEIYRSRIPVISAVGHEVDWALSDYVADLRAPTPSAAAELVSRDKAQLLETIMSLKQRLQKDVRSRLQDAKMALSKAGSDSLRYIVENKISRARMDLENFKNTSLNKVKERLWKVSGAARGFGIKADGLVRERLHEASGRVKSIMDSSLSFLKDTLRRAALKVEWFETTCPHLVELSMRDARARLKVSRIGIEASGPRKILDRGFSIVRGKAGNVVKAASALKPGERLSVTFAKGCADVVVTETEE